MCVRVWGGGVGREAGDVIGGLDEDGNVMLYEQAAPEGEGGGGGGAAR